MRYTVALTGGIGSGKSTVANAFADLGINIIDADIIARQVVEPGTPALKAIEEHFGSEVIAADGSLQRRILRERIFSAPEEKSWLNALLHPLIQQETQRQFQQVTSPYLLWVVPLLVENSLYKKADRVLVVDVTPETQLRRTMQRDDVTREHVEQILAARQRVKRGWPWQTMLLIIMAHRKPSPRMSPACTRSICNARRSLSHRKNRNAHPGPF